MSLSDKAKAAREHAGRCIDRGCHAVANALEAAVRAEGDELLARAQAPGAPAEAGVACARGVQRAVPEAPGGPMGLFDAAKRARQHADACLNPCCHAVANALEGAVDAEARAILDAQREPVDTSGLPDPPLSHIAILRPEAHN